ncbi:MAG TPA: LamG-like jellyroll fold domain-containing protein [Lacunisphaera sp.]
MSVPLSAQIAQVQHASSINGKVDGSLQQMSAESVNFNGGANVTGDLSVPGTPTVQLNGTPVYSGTLQGSGTSSPSNYTIMLNSGASLRHVIRRTNAVSLPTVGAVAAPTGTTSVTVNSGGQSITWATLKNLTLNSNAGQYPVPAGSYGSFNAGSGSGFKLGVAGATQASVYNFQNLTLNGNSTLQILGPVVINLANGFSANAPVGASTNPAWLALNIKSGGFTLNSGCNFYGYLLAPSGQVIINAGTQLLGGVACANLTVNGNGLLKLQAPQACNHLPAVSLTAPTSGAAYTAPGSFTLSATASDPDGTVSKVEFFQGTTKIGEDANAPYNFPVSGLNAGNYSYFARVTDNTGATADSSTISITVSSPNLPPTVALTAPVDGATFIAPATITLTASAADADGTIAHVDFYQGSALIGQGLNAPYSISTSTLFTGSYVFSAKAYDNSGALTTSSAVNVTVLNPNQPPTVAITSPATGASYDDPANFSINASASDPDGSIAKVELFQNGSRVGQSLSTPFTFAISGLPMGIYDFVARATDNQNSAVDSAPVRITVVHVNDAPAAHNQTQATLEDTPLTLTLTGFDPDGDALSYAIVALPAHGSLVPGATAATFVYTPAPDFNGPDFFTFCVSDGSLQSAPATVQLNVTPVNDAPISFPVAIALDENTSTNLTLAATDVDSPVLTFSIISSPAYGTISGTLPNITYTPAANYNGPDSLIYKVYDGELFSAPATITFTVNHVNRPPIVGFTAPVANASFIFPAAFTLEAAASDSDGTVTKVEFFQDGVKIGETSTVPYQFDVTSLAPGNYSFLASATDSSGAVTDSASLPVIVVANIPPTASLTSPVDGATLTAPATVTISVNAADSDGTIAHVDFYQGSTLIGQSASAPFNFTTGALIAGTFSFSAKAYDNLGTVGSTSVATITVINPNQPPSVALTAPVSGTVVAGPATITLTASARDADGTVTKVEFFNGSEKIGETTTVPYRISWPDVASGNFTLTARATDNRDATSISLPVTVSVNVPPSANSQEVTTSEDGSTAITLSGSDVETAAGSLTYSVIAQPAHGSLSGTVPNLVYTPAANYSGSDAFTFKVNDGAFDSSPAMISITVQAVNHAPVATGPFSLTTAEDTAANIILTAADAEGSPLAYSIVTPPQHGAISGAAPNLTYIPSANYNGSDSFTFKANDGSMDSAPATVNIMITPVNDIPVADSATISLTAGTSVIFTLTGSDVETPVGSLTFGVITNPLHGALSGTPPNLTYTPVSDFVGSDVFTFKVNDGTADSPEATIAIQVANFPQAPRIVSQPQLTLVLPSTRLNQTAVNFTPIELKPSDVNSTSSTVFSTLPTANPSLFGLTGTDVRKVNFDKLPDGTALTNGTVLTDQYASVGVTMNSIPVRSDIYEGPASPPFTTFTTGNGARQVFTFNVPVVAAGVINTSPDHDLFEFYAPDGTRLFSTGDTAPDSETDRFVGARVNDGNLIGSMVLVNTGGDDEMDELIFEVLTDQVLPGYYQYPVRAVDPANLGLTYSLIEGPAGVRIDPVTGLLSWAIRGVDAGDHTIVVRATNSAGFFDTQSFLLHVLVNARPTITAGPDLIAHEPNQPLKLPGIVSDDGVPSKTALNMTWSKLSGAGDVLFDNPNIAQPLATFSAPGIYVLQLTASDGLEQSTDIMEVRVGLTYSATIPRTAAAWWTGNDVAYDSIHGSHTIGFNGPLTYGEGKVARSFAFVGGTSYGSVPAHSDLDIGSSAEGLTVELWVNPAEAHDVPLVQWSSGNSDGLSLRSWINGSGLYAFLTDTAGVGHSFGVNSILPLNTWSHVAVTYDKATGIGRLYRNGTLLIEQTLGIFTPQTMYPMLFGALPREARYFKGSLDEITLYSRPLTLAEIKAIYDSGNAGKSPVSDNLPPSVDAGADVQTFGTVWSAFLNGSISDDGKPVGNGANLNIAWSKVDGPGEVAFADSNSAKTSATFSAPGTYILRLVANDGELQSDDTVTVRVGLTNSVAIPGAISAWWPANAEVHEVINGNHDVEFLPRGPGFGAGEQGQAFTFNGSDVYGRVPAHPDLDIGVSAAGLTVELWVNPAEAHDVPLVQWSSGNSDGLSLRSWINGSGLYAFLTDTTGVGHSFGVNSILPLNTWSHVAVTYDKATGIGRLYRNGTLLIEQALGIFTPQTTYPLLFGALPREGRYFKGSIDEITLYRRALSLGELQAIYSAGPDGKSSSSNQTPVVSAGPDKQAFGDERTVTLNGSVSDDGKPLGVGVISTWSKVDGPGGVAFANANAAATTATFDTPGTFVLRLDATDGELRSGDTTTVRVALTNGVETPAGIAAWWPANAEIHEVINGNHDVEFLPRGPGYGAGEQGEGFVFNGSDCYGRIPAHGDLDLGASEAGLTIELWLNPAHANDVPLVQWSSGSKDGVSVRTWINGTGLYAFLTDTSGGAHSIGVDNVIIASAWNHVAVTYDKVTGNARLYRNGTMLKEQNLGVFIPQTSYPLMFGALPREGRYYNGALDEIAFYKRALAPAEIYGIYQAGAAGKAVDNKAPLVNAGSDIQVRDAAGIALLTGSVQDDGKPLGFGVISTWSKVDGPGTVTFANANAASTTATFGSPGTYLLRLDATDGELHAGDTITVRVALTNSVETPAGIAAWWPANAEVHEVINGNHDVEFLPRGPSFGAGEQGEGFAFNGSDCYGRISAHGDLDLGSSAAGLTIELWMKPAGLSDVPLVQWNSGSSDGLSLRAWINGAGLYAFFTDTTGVAHQVGIDNVITKNVWSHVAVTYDRITGVARLYRNGTMLKEQNLGLFTPQTSYPLMFGALPRENRYYNGVLDEITFYRRPLTAAEIVAIYNAGSAGKGPSNTAPIVNAGPDTLLAMGTPLSLAGVASDDGLPVSPGALTYQWSKVDGPGIVNFASATSAATTATFDVAGTYTLRLVASDSVFTGSDELTVTVVQPPSVEITSPVNGGVAVAHSALSLMATATDPNADVTVAKVEFYDGDVKLGEVTAAPYSLPVQNGFESGPHVLTAKVFTSIETSAISAPVTLNVLTGPPPAPVLELVSPGLGAEVTAPVNLVGTASGQYLKSYVVQVRYKTSANNSPWKTIATGATSVVNASLGQLDPTLLRNGLYEIRLSATDQLNRAFDQAAPFNWVQITGAMKIGANVSNNTDLTIPTRGLPLSVVRHYDSTDPRVGDFGTGTTLAGQACTVQVSQRLGENWFAYTVSGFNGLPQYVIDPAPPLDATGVDPEPRVVAITLPDNTTFRFTPRLTPNHIYTEIAGGNIVFDPLPGTIGQLDAVNESTFEVENDVLADSNFDFTDLLGIDDGEPLDPKAYRLTTLDGTQYVISTTKGVLKVTDRTGAWTTYSPTRIEQSNGTVIELVRDDSGRITSVKDPSGKSITYAYDPSGRLLTVLDRDGHTTTYGYLEGTSLVTTIQSPAAIRPEYDAYDAVGRLISKTEGLLANGDVITERDFANRIEKRRDALGRITIVEYDEFGNVVRRTNALGNVTTYAFTDSRFRDKPTSITDAEGGVIRYHYNAAGLADTVTDANGHATSYTYNSTGQILAETDALGRATVQTYDAQGNLLTRKDREGNTTSFTYDSVGNRLTEHSPLGNETRYTYNALGLPLTETEYAPDNTAGRKRSYAFDANGNIASDVSYRPDSQGTLVPVTTSYTYNLNGQPTKTTYPDGTFSTKSYNTSGLLGSETDRSGAVVNYTYDDADRLTRTTFADNSYEEKTYDAVGRVMSERNALGQISTNTYDDADHLLSIDFPGIGSQQHTYDKVGRVLTDTDEGGRVTSTAYDPAGNVSKVTYPDGTSTDLAYNEVDDLMSASARVFFAPDAMDVTYNPIPAGMDAAAPNALAELPTPERLASSSNSADTVFSRMLLPFGYRAIPARFTLRGKEVRSRGTFGRKRMLLAQAAPPPSTPAQHLYNYTYDANGRMTSIKNPDNSDSHIEYDAIGRPTKTTNEEGQVWTYEYDPSTNDPACRTAVKGPLGYVESCQYGPSGDMEYAVDPIGNITEHHYNTLGQCTEIKYSDPRGQNFTTEIFDAFDKEGNPTTITDREGFVTTIDDQRTKNTKSGDRVLTRTVGNDSYVTTETYDVAGNLVQAVDPRGAVTKYDYDFFNRRTLTTLPDGRKIETVYGPRNRVDKVNEIASDGTDTHTTAYEYDDNDKVVRTVQSHKVAADSITVDSQYLSDGRAKSVSAPYLADETPHNTTIDYDDVNRTVTITDPMGRLTVRKQDKLGRLIDDTDTAGTTTHRDYDELNRLTAIMVTGLPDPVTHAVVSGKTAMTYDAMGNLLSRTEAAGTADARTTSYAYDFQGNGTLVTTTFADGSKPKSFQDTRGLVTSTTTPRGNTVLTTYDAIGRPLSVTGPLGQESDYTYPDFGKTQVVTDAAGRVTTRTFDTSQRLIEEKLPGSFGSRVYTYDSFSKLKTAKNTRGYITTTEYDFLGRPAKVTRPDASTIATTYTALGQPRRVTDARGFVTQYDYDPALHHLISVTAAEGDAKARTTAYGYDSADRMNQVTAANGQVTDSVFDALGRLASRSSTLDTDGTKYSESFTYYQTGELKVHHDIQGDTTHVYDATGHLKSLTNPLNEITLTEYDSEGNLTKTTDALNRVTSYTYDALDRLATTTLPQGATETNTYDAYHLTKRTLAPTTGEGDPIVTEFGYDELDRLTTTTRHHSPDNVVESRLYDGDGNLTKTTDAAGYETAFVYDSLNQLQTITHPDASTESFTYDGQGNRLTHTHAPIADDRTYTYTPHGEIETVTDALGHASSYTYDDAGNSHIATDPMGRITTSTYDLANRLRTVTQPSNRVSTFDYDTVGNRVAVTDPANRTRRFEYDSLGRLKRALTPLYNALSPMAANHSDPSGSVVDIAGQKFAASQLTYDPVGNLETLTDPNNHATTFKYDAGNHPTRTYLPANPSAAYEVNTYDFAGRRTARADADGATTIYGYDSLSRLMSVQPPSSRIGANVGYTYDPRGLRSSMTDGLGTTNYTYDNRGRLHSEQTPYAGSMVYTHDQLGRLTNQHSTNLGGVNTTYEYDDASRLANVVDALRSETTTYNYNDADQPTRVAQPNGTVTTQTYDAAGRPDVTTTSSGFGALFSQQYTYTPTDQIDTLTTTIGRPAPFLPLHNGVGYTYDSSDRLLREIHLGDSVNGQIDYTLDPAGNRTARSSTVAGVDAQSFVFDANNALASPFVYDSRGNPTAGPLFPGSFADTYDYLDQHATRNGKVEYIYDGDGRRVGHRTLDPVSGRWITHTRLISSLNPTVYDQDAEEFTDGVLSSSYTLGHSRLAGTRFVDETVTALGLTIGLGADGKVYVWGNGQATPTAIPGLSNIIAVGAGASHYLALGADGKVYSWGTSNGSGQLGRTGDIGTPAAIPGLSDVSAISTQLDHTLALTTDGTVYAWGDNSSGQLGDGTTTNRDAPVPVATGAIAIAAGQVHSYALMLGGTAEAWGDNTYGQLGQESISRELVPTTVPGLTGVNELAAGAFHALALKTDGTLVTWGDNTFGQLGDPAVIPSRSAPMPVVGIAGLTEVAAGARHSLALQSDGTLLAWGENRSGQLGTAYPANLYIPTPVPGLTNLVRLAAGARSSYATTADGATYVMGANRNGQLGTGNTASATTPQLLPAGTNPAFAAIASGGESGASKTTHAAGFRDQFFPFDVHDHTRLLTDVTGAVTQTYSYDAFGNLLNATDRSGYSLPATRYSLLTASNPYLYRGERLEAETGRYHLRARDYDASLGRLATLDAFAGDPTSPMSLNRYAYAGANPVGNADPTGHFSISVWELLGQMDEINHQWDEIASVGRQEEFDPEQALANFNSALAGGPTSNLTITKKERAIWMNASRQGGLIGSLADDSAQGTYEASSVDSAGNITTGTATKGYAAGSDVFFHTNANPRNRLSTIERTVEQGWASAYNLRHTINTGLPITSTDPKAWQTRWPAHLYHDAMLQAQLRSQMIEGPVEARFTLSLNRKIYNQARVTLTASAIKNLNAAQAGGLLDWQSLAPSGTQGAETDFRLSIRATGFEDDSQYQLFRDGYREGYKKASPGIGVFAAGAVLAFVPGLGSAEASVSGMILSGIRTGLIFTGTKQIVNVAVGAQNKFSLKEAAVDVGSVAAVEFGFRAFSAGVDGLIDLPLSQLAGKATRVSRQAASRAIDIADNFAQDARALVRGGIKGAGRSQEQLNMGVDPTHIFDGAMKELRLGRTGRAAGNLEKQQLLEESISITAFENEEGTILPQANENIQLAQKGVRSTFTTKAENSRFKYAGMTIAEVANGLRKGTILADELPIEFVIIEGERFAVNNRSLLALRRANLQPTRTIDVTKNVSKMERVRERLYEIDNLGLPRDATMIRGGPANASKLD